MYLLSAVLFCSSLPVLGQEPDNPVRLGIRTNLLYDAALLPNLSVEFPFAGGWSAAVSGYWSWWDTGGPRYWTHRVQWAGAELRRWISSRNRRAMRGHFAGLYASGGNYDLRLLANSAGDYGYQSDWSWSAGVTYGYVKPLSGRLSLEFSIGAGYFHGNYRAYNLVRCKTCYPERERGTVRYLGPTSAGISLVYRIGHE